MASKYSEKWERRCVAENKQLIHGYSMSEGCIPRPYKTHSKAEREKIRKMSKNTCLKNAHAYWRGKDGANMWVKNHCANIKKNPIEMESKSKLTSIWNDFVRKRVEDVCEKGIDGSKSLSSKQIPYCRVSANYIRQNVLGRSAFGKINELSAKVGRKEITLFKAMKEYQSYLDYKPRFRGLPKIGLFEAKLLMDQKRSIKEAKKNGRSKKELTINQLRKKNEKYKNEIINQLKKELQS